VTGENVASGPAKKNWPFNLLILTFRKKKRALIAGGKVKGGESLASFGAFGGKDSAYHPRPSVDKERGVARICKEFFRL